MDMAALRAELLTDPLALGYSGLGDQAAADKLNAVNTGRTLPRTAVSASEILGAIDNGAWPSTAILQNKLLILLSVDPIDATNTNIRGVIGSIFPAAGGTQATRDRLLALSTRVASRAEELGLDVVTEGAVVGARSGNW